MAQRRNWRDTLVKAVIYLEGGGDSKELHSRCREGFRKLLESSGFKGAMPRLVACGGRSVTFDDFKTAHLNNKAKYVAMLIDSEEPVADPEKTWGHLKNLKTVDNWEKPDRADDKQVLFMATCMETWIVADRETLKKHYGSDLLESALPALEKLEQRDRHDIQNKLVHATRNCKNVYAKGKRSFEVLCKLSPDVLRKHLQSFKRMERILKESL